MWSSAEDAPRLPAEEEAEDAGSVADDFVDPLVGETASLKEGALERSLELERELKARGIDFEFLDKPPQCSLLGPARRACKRFVLPRSPKALQVAMAPGRAAAVADEVLKLVNAAAAQREAWERRSQEVAEAAKPWPLAVVLDGIRSTQNVGTLLQVCASTRVAEVVLCGITPAPPDPAVLRFAGPAATRVLQRRAPSGLVAVHDLKSRGFEVWAMETTSRATALGDLMPPQPLAIVLGHENCGVSVDVLDACNRHVVIPMRGMKNSLNVAVAGGIAMFEIIRRWRHGV